MQRATICSATCAARTPQSSRHLRGAREAKDGQILIAQCVAVAVAQGVELEEIGALTLKGLTQPVVAFNVPLAGSKAGFRVIEGGPPRI